MRSRGRNFGEWPFDKKRFTVYIDIAVDVCENFCKTCENHKKHGNMLSIHVNKRLKIGDIR